MVAFRIFIICSLLMLSVSIFAKSSELVPLEAYGALPTVGMMAISPSGDKVAYRRTEDTEDFMVVFDFTQGKIIGGVDLSNIRPSHMYFVDEKRIILVVSRNTKIFGFRGRHDVSRAHSYNLETNKLIPLLTLGEGIYSGQSQLGTIVGISSDGSKAFMPAWENESTYSLMRANLDRKRKAKRHKRGSNDVIDYFVNDKDQVLARERYNNKTNIHSVEALTNNGWKVIFKEETRYKTKGFVGVTSDFNNLVMIEENANTDHWAYYTISLKDGMKSEPIFSQPNKSVESVLSDINRIVYGVRYAGFKPSYEFFDKDVEKKVNALIDSMPNNSLTIVDHTPDWKKIIFLLEGDNSEGEYLLHANNKITIVASQRPSIEPEQVHQIYQTKYKARDGLKIPLLLTLPNVELERLPAILMPHGGPASYDRIGFDWMAQYFASRGYLVIQPQFRGSEGFGSEFTLKGRGEWGRKMQDDLTDSLKVLVKSGYVDPKRVCIVGASYGGYAALAGAAFTPEKYKCAVSINGVSDVERMLNDEKRDYGKNHWVVSYWEDSIANNEVSEDFLQKISPINHVHNISIPILLIHGEHDEVVPLRQSENMYDELKDANKHVEFVELDKGDHYLSNGKNRMQALKAIDKFITSHL